jgi:hypothetical protein
MRIPIVTFVVQLSSRPLIRLPSPFAFHLPIFENNVFCYFRYFQLVFFEVFIGELSSNYQWRTRPTSTCTKSELR